MPTEAGGKTIRDVLQENGLLPADKAERALDESQRTGQPLQQVVVDMKLTTKQDILSCLSKEWNAKAVNLLEMEIDADVVKLIPEATARRHRAVPFAKEEHALFVAMADPRDLFAIDDIQMRTNFSVQPYLAMPADITAIMDKVYRGALLPGEEKQAGAEEENSDSLDQVELEDVMKGIATGADDLQVQKAEDAEAVADVTKVSANAPEIERLVNGIILGALKIKASDIHVEPFEKKLVVRYRVDGDLREAPFRVPANYHNALIAKIKIMTNQMNITEHRRPQDGRIQILAKGKPIEFRVNVVPTVYGESCVMRVLDRSSIQVDMSKMGFLPDTLEKLKQSIGKPYGLCLVCGPTGSGKSTTLYAALNAINTSDVKILTAENPVEYNLPGIVQVNVNQEIKPPFDFAEALRAFLRQDPDIIMVGEIRDKETAQIAMEASMTGHLVFSTIHTNDAPSAVGRLHEMGVPSFLVSSAVECVLAQRLVRRVCSACKEPFTLTPELRELFESNKIDLKKATLFKGKGCSVCTQTGYKGRLGIHELLVMDDELRRLLLEEVATGPIREMAIKKGMRALLQDGLIKVTMGHSTIEEVLGVAQ